MRGIDSRVETLEKQDHDRKVKVCLMFWERMTYEEAVLWKKWAEAQADRIDWDITTLELAKLWRSDTKFAECVTEVYGHILPEFVSDIAAAEKEFGVEPCGSAIDRINHIADFLDSEAVKEAENEQSN